MRRFVRVNGHIALVVGLVEFLTRFTVAAIRRTWGVTLVLAALLLVLMREGLDLTDEGVRWLRLRHEASYNNNHQIKE
jgi:hypothetical protein